MSRAPVVRLIACLLSTTVAAQTDLVTTPPPNLVIPNYNSTPVGPFGGLEGAAFVARIGDPSAAWFNPAGLARQMTAQISGSAGVYQLTHVSPEALPNEGGAVQQLPNFVGFTFIPREGLTVGAAFLSTNAWNQETDAELLPSAAGSQRRFAYSADSGFEQREAALGVGYRRTESWRLGGGLSFSLMDLRLVQSASDRVADSTGLRSLLVSARASGSAVQLRGQGGVQYARNLWRLGGAFRTPGVTIHKTGSVVLDGVLAGQAGSLGASLFDPQADLTYRLPWEFQAGAALVGERFELEVDLQAYTPLGAYSLLSSGQPVRVYADAGSESPPLVTSAPFAGFTAASDGVLNVAVGGHIRPLRHRDLLVHAGIGSNRSQVAPEDALFTDVDLLTWSVGASGTWRRLQFAVGVNSQIGTADDVTLRNLLSRQEVHSPVDVRIRGFIYSIAYQF